MNPSFSFLFIKKYQGCERFFWLMVMYKYVNECIWMLIAVLKIISNVLIVWKPKNKTFLVCNLIAHIVIFKSSWISSPWEKVLIGRNVSEIYVVILRKDWPFLQKFIWKNKQKYETKLMYENGPGFFFQTFSLLDFHRWNVRVVE